MTSGLGLDLDGYDWLYDGRIETTLWGNEPGRLVRRLAEWSSSSGRALDAGCGDGKNAACLEDRGWSVTGFDKSSLALSILASRSPRLNGRYTNQGLDEFLCSSDEEFDLIVSYGLFHCLEARSRLRQHRKLQARLRPGGVLLFATLTDLLPWPTGHGTNGYVLANEDELFELTPSYEVLYREEGILTEHHLPRIGTHQHASAWLVLRRPM